MNQSDDFGLILKLWPNLVDHYNLVTSRIVFFILAAFIMLSSSSPRPVFRFSANLSHLKSRTSTNTKASYHVD